MKNRAFTLIELLVVVLIIGILAVIAVPQYQKAVVKSRVATILPIMADIIQAQEIYYLNHGQYTDNANLMDLFPASCSEVQNDDEGGTWKCGNDFLLDIDPGRVLANYCPKYNNSYTECKPKRIFQIGFGASNLSPSSIYPAPNSRRCWSSNNFEEGVEICNMLGKQVPGTATYELY